jgi:predicted XRE-type DNA-binding protein
MECDEIFFSAFHKLGFQNANELVTKSQLMRFVLAKIKKRNLTQIAAGEILGLDQLNVLALMNEKISRFSVDNLMEFAGKLSFSGTIHIEGKGLKINVPVLTAT